MEGEKKEGLEEEKRKRERQKLFLRTSEWSNKQRCFSALSYMLNPLFRLSLSLSVSFPLPPSCSAGSGPEDTVEPALSELLQTRTDIRPLIKPREKSNGL